MGLAVRRGSRAALRSQAGTVRATYFRADRHTAVLVLECAGADEARAAYANHEAIAYYQAAIERRVELAPAEPSLQERLGDVSLNGHPTERLAGNLNVSFAHVQADALMTALRDVAVSSGSACTSATIEPSHVLRALGLDDELAHSSIRFGLGRFTTAAEIDYVIEEVARQVERLRAFSPDYELARAGRA